MFELGDPSSIVFLTVPYLTKTTGWPDLNSWATRYTWRANTQINMTHSTQQGEVVGHMQGPLTTELLMVHLVSVTSFYFIAFRIYLKVLYLGGPIKNN